MQRFLASLAVALMLASCVAATASIMTPIAAVQQDQPTQARKLDPKSFAGALQGQLAKLDRKTLSERRIERILNSPDSEKRDRQLSRMERHVRAHLDLHPTNAVDWGADIDWPSLLETILDLLIAILPLFL